MLGRIKQFWRAIWACEQHIDYEFVNCWLSPREFTLFAEYAVYDKLHAVNVANTALNLMKNENYSPEFELKDLMQASLLHDVGRTARDMTLLGKVFAVLVHKICPHVLSYGRYNALRHKKSWRHMLYVYCHHAEIGAEKLTAIDCSVNIVDAVRAHHEPLKESDGVMTRLLKMADSQN